MPRRLVSTAFCLVAPFATMAQQLPEALAACRGIAENDQRLACYDAIPDGQNDLVFSGSGSAVTPFFDVEDSRKMQFESQDVIMVLYLLDEQGQVVQNLHLGGASRSTYQIDVPGRYQLQVNASGGWRITLD